jgi:hypothetical protein
MKTKIVALTSTPITGTTAAGQTRSPRVPYYDGCDVQLHDAYGRIAPDDQHTVFSNKANRSGERSTQPTTISSIKEVADAQG